MVDIWDTGLLRLNLTNKGRGKLNFRIRYEVRILEFTDELIPTIKEDWSWNFTFVAKLVIFGQENHTVWWKKRLFFPIPSGKHGFKYFTILARRCLLELNGPATFTKKLIYCFVTNNDVSVQFSLHVFML